MSMTQTLKDDCKTAMKARDRDRVKTLRMLIANLQNAAIDARKPLDDVGEMTIMLRAAKQRRESITAFEKAEREDLAVIERDELAIISAYLPSQMTEDEAKAIVVEVIAAVGATSRKDFGKIMKVLMPRLKGRFPGNAVRPLVNAVLG